MTRTETIGDVTLLNGDAMALLPTLAAGSVHCCVTSPPYYGLRDYGLPPTIWGGDAVCKHKWADTSWKPDRWGVHDDDKPGEKQRTSNGSLGHRGSIRKQSTCANCGAWSGALGLEPTPQLFVDHLVMVFREVLHVLRDDGTVWVNLGDSYSHDTKWGGQSGNKGAHSQNGGYRSARNGRINTGLPGKNLVGVPWRFALAMQADGWYLRNDVIWEKPNCMTESAGDRLTRSHEYIFMFAKKSRYYFDADAISEPCESGPSDVKKMIEQLPRIGGKHKDLDDPLSKASACTNIGRKRAVGGKPRDPGPRTPRPGIDVNGGNQANGQIPNNNLFRNRRSVWTVATIPYKKAHFATFPPALIEPCILAGAPIGGIVLDPFIGSGTTAEVATLAGRGCIGIEMNPEYFQLAMNRTRAAVEQAAMPLFEKEDTATKAEQAELFDS